MAKGNRGEKGWGGFKNANPLRAFLRVAFQGEARKLLFGFVNNSFSGLTHHSDSSHNLKGRIQLLAHIIGQ
jgi:hypothetical protein